MRTYLCLKYQYSNKAYIKQGCEGLKLAQHKLGISEKSLKRHLKKLHKVGFVGRNRYGDYNIRGYESLINKFKLPKTRKVEVTEKELLDSNYTPYMFGSVVGYVALKHKFDLLWAELIKGGLRHARVKSKIQKIDVSKSLSFSYIAEMLKVSQSYCHEMLTEAKRLNYIHFKSDESKTTIPASQFRSMRLAWQVGDPFPTPRDGFIYLTQPNRYENTLCYKKIRFK